MTINEKIFNTIAEKGLKQSDLAKVLNLTTGQITAWKKRGTTPPAEYLINICKFLDITILELLGEKEEKPNKQEQELLEYFRNCSSNNQSIIINAAKSLQEPEKQETKSSTLKIG